MPCSTFNHLTLQKYQPDPEDLCSLCGGNHGKAAMINVRTKSTYALIALMSSLISKMKEKIKSVARLFAP